MAITNIYQDLIMNPENMPNRLQNYLLGFDNQKD